MRKQGVSVIIIHEPNRVSDNKVQCIASFQALPFHEQLLGVYAPGVG